MLPEEKARVKIDKQLNNAGWDIVDRKDYLPNYAMAVKEALMQGGKESDYLLFVDNKAIGVVEAKKESDSLGPKVASQAEHYAKTPQNNNKADKSASNSLNPCKAKKALSHLYDKASVHIIHDQISVSLSASLFLPNPEAKRSTKSGTISRTLVSPS